MPQNMQTYVDQIFKLIPAELTAAYVVLNGLIPLLDSNASKQAYLCFLLVVLFTFISVVLSRRNGASSLNIVFAAFCLILWMLYISFNLVANNLLDIGITNSYWLLFFMIILIVIGNLFVFKKEVEQ